MVTSEQTRSPGVTTCVGCVGQWVGEERRQGPQASLASMSMLINHLSLAALGLPAKSSHRLTRTSSLEASPRTSAPGFQKTSRSRRAFPGKSRIRLAHPPHYEFWTMWVSDAVQVGVSKCHVAQWYWEAGPGTRPCLFWQRAAAVHGPPQICRTCATPPHAQIE